MSVRIIEALKSNRLYFSTANHYDDPFYSFINVRINDIRFFLSNAGDKKGEKLGKEISAVKKLFMKTEINEEHSLFCA